MIPLHYVPLQAAEDVDFSGTSAQSTAAPANATHARLCATADCRILVGSNPTALADSQLLPAGVVEFIPICESLKVAALQETSAGKLSVLFVTGV